VTINGGMPMRAWYDILGTDLVRREDEAGLREIDSPPCTRCSTAKWRAACPHTHRAGRLFARLRHHAGRRPALRPAPGRPGRAVGLPAAGRHHGGRAPAANRETPVFLAHGRHDGVVPLARGTAARDLLQAQGQPLEWHDYPMEHSVCIEEVRALQRWLLRVLAPG
jgi:phospholipase/carboxylesterase